jgi:predicted DNA-binding protein (MmcQ/YjbR family)
VELDQVIAIVQAALDGKPGAVADPAAVAGAFLYKVKGKMFAILATRGVAAVSLKCDPHLGEILREQYACVGHRYHLDRRHWISVTLDADVPPDEIVRLVDQSYDLVRANLTRAQRAELDALP